MTEKLERIMFIDDEDDIRTVARVALESVGGMTVETCSGGQEALTRFDEFKPDLVLLDVMMPDMDGPTTFQRLRELPGGANIPIVFFTAKTQAHEVTSLRDLGALTVLTKPFDPMKLTDDIRAAWEKRHG